MMTTERITDSRRIRKRKKKKKKNDQYVKVDMQTVNKTFYVILIYATLIILCYVTVICKLTYFVHC